MMQFLTYDNWYLTLLVFKFIFLKGKVAMSTTSLKCRDGILPHIENHQYSGIFFFFIGIFEIQIYESVLLRPWYNW